MPCAPDAAMSMRVTLSVLLLTAAMMYAESATMYCCGASAVHRDTAMSMVVIQAVTLTMDQRASM